MNEQLQQALAAILNKTMAGVEAGASFLQAELPEVIQQLLMWKLAEASIKSLAAIAVIVCFVAFMRVYYRAETGSALKDYDYCPTFAGFAAITIGACATLVSVIGLSHYPMIAAQILVAPKLYLIEYAASLAK